MPREAYRIWPTVGRHRGEGYWEQPQRLLAENKEGACSVLCSCECPFQRGFPCLRLRFLCAEEALSPDLLQKLEPATKALDTQLSILTFFFLETKLNPGSQGESTGLGLHKRWLLGPALPLTLHITLAKSLNLCGQHLTPPGGEWESAVYHRHRTDIPRGFTVGHTLPKAWGPKQHHIYSHGTLCNKYYLHPHFQMRKPRKRWLGDTHKLTVSKGGFGCQNCGFLCS